MQNAKIIDLKSYRLRRQAVETAEARDNVRAVVPQMASMPVMWFPVIYWVPVGPYFT